MERSIVERVMGAVGAAEPSGLTAWVRFAELVETWNRRANLTGASGGEALAEILFADAAVLADRDVVPEGARLLDVGAGAGAPAIPLALARSDVRLTLIEPRRKRVAFMRNALGTLDLVDRATVLEQRLEGAPLEGAPFDVAMSRATFEPAMWLARAAGLGRRVLVLSSGAVPSDAHWALVMTRDYRLPFSGSTRKLLVYEPSRDS